MSNINDFTPEQQTEIEVLAALPDDEIDTSDAPELDGYEGTEGFPDGGYDTTKETLEIAEKYRALSGIDVREFLAFYAGYKAGKTDKAGSKGWRAYGTVSWGIKGYKAGQEEYRKIEAKWDELLSTPESHTFLDKLEQEAKADQVAGNLIPGGFGKAEFTDELELAVKTLISKVQEGMTEREQREVAGFIDEAIACVEVDRVEDDEVEVDPYEDTAEDVFDEIGTIVGRAGMFMGFGVTTAGNKNVLKKYAEKIKDATKRLDVAIEKQTEVSEEEWQKPFHGLNFRRRINDEAKHTPHDSSTEEDTDGEEQTCREE